MKLSGKFADNSFKDKVKKLGSLDGKGLEIGWFDEQHPTANMTFAELAHYHAVGGGGKVVPRNVLQKFLAIYPFDKDGSATRALSSWIDNPSSPDILLDTIGQDSVSKIKALFGSSHLTPTAANPYPLVDTGALRDKTEYKKK